MYGCPRPCSTFVAVPRLAGGEKKHRVSCRSCRPVSYSGRCFLFYSVSLFAARRTCAQTNVISNVFRTTG